MKINIKLILGFLVVALLVGVVGYIGYSGVLNVFEHFDVIVDETAPELAILGEIGIQASRLQTEAVSFTLIRAEKAEEEEKEEEKEEEAEFEAANKKLDKAIQQLEKAEEEEEEEEERARERVFIEEIKESKIKLYNAALALINGKRQGKSGPEILDLKEELEEIEEELEEIIDARITSERDELVRRGTLAEEIASTATKLILIVIIVAIILAIILGLFISRSISQPVTKLRDASIEIGKGKLGTKIDITSKDEIGDLANSFKDMTVDLQKSRKELQKLPQKLEKEVKERTAELEKSKKILEKGSKEKEKQRVATLHILKDVDKAKKELEKSYEELKGLDKLKTQFLSITSHELRSPITPMKLQMGLLLENRFGKLTKKQKESLEMISKNAEHLDKLIADILDISRIQAGGLKIKPKKIQLADCIKETIENVKSSAHRENITLRAKIAKLPEITADKHRIIQVLSNLINNAIKFTPAKGKVTIEAEKQKNSVLVKIKDTGIGIAEKDLKKIFEPFFQVDSSYTRKYKGSGLGLSVCKGIIEQHNGKIWAESKLGKGSTFYLTLPLKL